ncbi:DUF4921 family protein [Enemella sp. A6]|uniref:DUF4921 family protein n=1 Tax=Enemella sp. A6 TaxID=3440152 RepID=UPI003EB6F0B9
MSVSRIPTPEYLARLADGTVKQVNPFSGTQVWTVPGRGHRPLGIVRADPKKLDPADEGRYCAFCSDRYPDTPPEKSRLVLERGQWTQHDWVSRQELTNSTAEFRRIPNLFEILSYDYWHANYGYELATDNITARDRYLADPAGREHVLGVVRQRLAAGGRTPSEIEELTDEELLEYATGFFGGGHDVIVARRHYVDGATTDDELAGSGTLTPEEHYRYIKFTAGAAESLYAQNRYVRYVAVFQNWLKPAGASFDHLHKQLVAIDERGVQNEHELQVVRNNANIYNEAATNYAGYQNLVIAENEHAIAFAGFGHRYPTLEIYSRSTAIMPWQHTDAEIRGVSDLVHACHAATGTDVPCNEEWYYRPLDSDVAMPWRVMLKWRVSTLAGFEGGTKIYLNTLDPWAIRDRVVPKLYELREAGKIADMRIATECECRPNSLRYNPLLGGGRPVPRPATEQS